MPVVEIPIAEPGEPDVWWNYHKTGASRLGVRFALRSGEAGAGRKDIAENAEAVRQWLLRAKGAGVAVRPVGGAWSPSNIQLAPDGGWMLNTRRFNRCFRLAPTDFADPDAVDAQAFLLVEAGVQIDEINDKLESDVMRRSLRSTGASNGQTLAGACATATHGSVIEAGGIQDHVRAVQIVTPGGTYWIEPAPGLMSDTFIAETGSEAKRDDDAFAAALVHVGSLGVVTAMVIETVERYLVRPYLKLIDFREEHLELLNDGRFRDFSDEHGLPQDPYFVMVVTNPLKPFKRKAVVRFLYKIPWEPGHEEVEPAQLGAGYDAFTMLGWLLRNFPLARGWILQKIMELTVGNGIIDPIFGTWGQTTETHKPLANIFTGALFVERSQLKDAFNSARKVFAGAGGSTVMTLRFMKGGHGLLSPARWTDTAGIDCDGPDSEKTKDAFREIMKMFDREGIAFTRHWGKFNELSAARVAKDYGDNLVRWKKVRDALLPGEDDRRLFSADALKRFGLSD